MVLTYKNRFLWRAGPGNPFLPILRFLACWSALCLVGGAGRGEARTTQGPGSPASGAAQDLNDPKALEQRGDLYMVRKYYPEAVELYQRLTRLQPSNPLYHNKLGIAYHQLQDLNSAKRAYQRAIQLNPQYAEAVNNWGAVEYAEKNYRTAILTYLKALALSPSDAVVYSNLGSAYFAYEKFDYAMASYRYALILDPTIFERSGRVGSIVHQRDIRDVAAFNFYMAKTYASLGNVEQTLLYLQKCWEEGFPDIRKHLKDEAFAFLAPEPRFLELIALIEAAEQQKANAAQSAPPRP